jgi:hypothetical protein
MDGVSKTDVRVGTWSRSLGWARDHPWSWRGILATLVLCFIFFFVRPFAASPRLDADDLATSWNQSIARLGISPLFPPEEDFHVGDVWAVIADGEDTPLLGKAVRVAHLDLRDEIYKARNRQPVFADTASFAADGRGRGQSPIESNQTIDERIVLTLAAFPGLTITHTTRSAGSLGWSIGGLGAGRDDQSIEEIRIPVAETYGIPYADALVRLDDWCADEQTKIHCTDAFLRRVLAYSISNQVLATRNGKYIFRLHLRLVTRVFLTREIEQRRVVTSARGGTAQSSAETVRRADPANAGENKTLEVRNRDALDTLTQNVGSTSRGGGPSATISNFLAGGSEIEIHRVFQRPVAFGFRAVTISLTPATPSTSDVSP